MKQQFERLKEFWNKPHGPICLLSAIIAILDVLFLDVTFVTFFLLLLSSSFWLLNKIEEMEFPGGFKLKTKELKEITEKAKDAGLFKNNNKKDYHLKIYEDDPNLALAGLRIEIEKKLYELADLAGIDTSNQTQYRKSWSISKLRQELNERDILSNKASALLADLIPTLNHASHGQKVTKEVSDWVINDGYNIIAALDEIISSYTKK